MIIINPCTVPYVELIVTANNSECSTQLLEQNLEVQVFPLTHGKLFKVW